MAHYADRNIVEVGPEGAPYFVFYAADNSLRSLSFVNGVDISGTNLAIDTMTITVYHPYGPDTVGIIGGVDFDDVLSSDGYVFALDMQYKDIIKDVPYGTPIRYYRKGQLYAKMYKKSIEQVGFGLYKINAISAVGVLAGQKHLGGFYRNAKFSDVVAEIVGDGVEYTVADEVKDELVIGYLPYKSKRENLHWLTSCLGIMVGRDANLNMHFRFISNAETKQIQGVKFYTGGSIDYSTPVSAVEVTEHSFFSLPTDETVTIYDNSDGSETASHTFIAFRDAPIHDLTASGSLTIESSGVNWAIISGTGKLTGKKYTHSTRVIRKEQSEKIASMTDNTLINSANSENVAKRMLAYYSKRNDIKISFVNEGERCGDLVSGVDPYGNSISGFLVSMNGTASGVIKASSKIVTGYIPVGQGNNYSDYTVLTGTGSIDLAALVADKADDLIQIMLVGGGNGGGQGSPGKSGGRGTTSSYGTAGEGGEPGLPGDGGKVLTVTLHVNELAQKVLAYSCGAGGESDQEGGATTLGPYTSADGAASPYGVANIFTGALYAQRGGPGAAAGANGGDGSDGETERNMGHGMNTGGYGGTGATPPARAAAAGPGQGGDAGHGGGGGGGGGAATGPTGYYWEGSGGYGGQGGLGGRGGDGLILILR